MKKFILCTCLLLCALMGVNAQSTQAEVEIWDLYETEIHNSKNYNNPYMDVELRVDFIQPGGKTLSHLVFMTVIIPGKSGLARIKPATGGIKLTFQTVPLKQRDHLNVFQPRNRAGL